MHKLLRIGLWTLAVVIVLTAGLFAYLRNADLSIYKEQLETFASSRIGHELTIGGRFELHFGTVTRLVAEDVALSNPGWQSNPTLVQVGHLTIAVDTWSAFFGPFVVEELQVREIATYLEKDADGRTNWTPRIVREQQDSGGAFDTDRIAFKEVRIEGIELEIIDPAMRRPINATIGHLTISPDVNDILDLDLQGTANELPLWADGKLGPWQNFLDGRDISADFDLTLGPVSLTLRGSVDDLTNLEGVELNGVFSGPEIKQVIDRLGLPPLAAGKFEVSADVRRFESGHQVRIDGNLGEIEIFASGNIDSLLYPQTARYDFSVSGPDARHVAELFGFDGVPGGAFQVTGDYSRDARTLTFKDTLVRVGPNSVLLNGEVDISSRIPDGDVAILATGPDVSVLGPFISVSGLPEESFSIDGRIRKSGSTWEAQSVAVAVGEHQLRIDGLVEAGSSSTAKLSLHATGPDISVVQDFTELKGLPPQAYDVEATFRSDPAGIMIDNGKGVFGDNRIEVDGIIAVSAGMNGSTLKIRAQGPELHNIALLTGIPHLPAGPFEVSGDVRVDRDALVIDNANATAGAIQGSASGRVGLGSDAGHFDLNLKLQGPDASKLAALDWLQNLAGEPFTVEGNIENSKTDLTLSEARLQIGENLFTADGTLSMQPLSNDSDLKFSLAGPDLDQFGRAIGTDIFAAKAFNIAGQFTGTPGGFAVRDLAAQIGDNDVSGVFEIDLKDKPRLVGSLSSAYLDLTERLQLTEEQAEEAPGVVEDEFIFSNEPLDTELLQAADIEIDIDIDKLRARALAVSDFHIGIKLLDGELQLDPISFTERQGSVAGQVHIAPSAGSYMLNATLAIQNLHFGLTLSPDQDRSTLPPIGGDFTLRGQGNSLHELMASSSGGLSMRQGSGQIVNKGEDRLFGDMFLTILRTLNPMREKQVYREIDCAIYEVAIADGVATLEKFAVQSKTMTVFVVGNVDFNTEKLKLAIRAKPREGLGVSLGGAVNSFLRLGGTLRSPKLQIDPKGSAVTGGVAVATGGLSLLAKGLFDRMSGQVDICKPKINKKKN